MSRRWTFAPALFVSLCIAPAASADDSTAATASKPSVEREETFAERTDRSQWSTGKSVAVYASGALMLVSLGGSIFSFVKASDARSERRSDFPDGDCRTEADCRRLRDLVGDAPAWQDRGVAFTGAVFGFAAVTFGLAWLLPNGKNAVTPSAALTKNGASLGVVGSF